MHNFILMGVAGCGKTTIGTSAAQRLNIPFIDGDDFHSASARALMQTGRGLDEPARFEWVDRIAQARKAMLAENSSHAIIACSALQRSVRKRLRAGLDGAASFIHLTGSPRIIRNRLKARQGHFFKVNMLAGQYQDLELPMRAADLDIAKPVDDLVQDLISIIQNHKN